MNDARLFCRRTKPFLAEYLAAFFHVEKYPPKFTGAGLTVGLSRASGDIKGASIHSPNAQEEMNMRERDSKPLAEFVKIVKIGQTIAGKVIRYVAGTEGNSPFVVFEPVFLREEVGGAWAAYGTAAFGLPTDVARKCDSKDVGKFLLFQFTDTEATSKGGTKKLFKVYELDSAEVSALISKAVRSDDVPAFAAAGREPGEEDDQPSII